MTEDEIRKQAWLAELRARLSEAMAYLGFHLKMSTPSNVDA